MKKLFSIIIVFVLIFGLSACKNEFDAECTYLPGTEIRTNQNSSGFYREYKTVYEYDEKGNITKKTEYTKGFLGIVNVRENQTDIQYTYNENGNISKEVIRFEDFITSITDGHLIYEVCNNYAYNEQQQLIKKENNNSYEAGYKYEYDEHGNCIKEYKNDIDGTLKLEFENTYNSQNQLIKKQYIAYFADLTWVGYETDYTYDFDEKLAYSKTVYYDKFKGMTHYVEVQYRYDELNRLVKKEETCIGKSGEITQQDVREYKDFVMISKGKS